MRGRPKMEDSRDKQYRVRLNTGEDAMLEYVSSSTGKQKSEIFRKALEEYYQKVRVAEYYQKIREAEYTQEDEAEEDYDYNQEWEMEGISLKRIIDCPYCKTGNAMDFSEDCDTSYDKRQMGEEITYSFDREDCECCSCGKRFRVSGYICEYPVGAYNYEQIDVEKIEDEE